MRRSTHHSYHETRAGVKVIYSLLRLTDEHDRGPDYDPPEYLFNPKVTMFKSQWHGIRRVSTSWNSSVEGSGGMVGDGGGMGTVDRRSRSSGSRGSGRMGQWDTSLVQ